MVDGLLKTAQGVHPGAITTLSPNQDATFKLEAIKCLVGVCRSMGVWMNNQLRISDSSLVRNSQTDDLKVDTGITMLSTNGIREDAMNGMPYVICHQSPVTSQHIV
jgi:brefeldin A-inhibited guanine nucleotide-exchange protein